MRKLKVYIIYIIYLVINIRVIFNNIIIITIIYMKDDLNMLLIAPADPRHIIKTMARAWRYNNKFLNVIKKFLNKKLI